MLSATPALAADEPVATISVSSGTAGSSLGGRLVQGVMRFQGHDYLLTLRGIDTATMSKGSVRGMLRPRDIEGIYVPSDQGLRNVSGVTLRFEPALSLGSENKLEIELSRRIQPKVTEGNRESGVE